MADSYYRLEKSGNSKYYFTLRAPNHEVISTSQMYKTKAGAEKGLRSVQKNADTTTIKTRGTKPMAKQAAKKSAKKSSSAKLKPSDTAPPQDEAMEPAETEAQAPAKAETMAPDIQKTETKQTPGRVKAWKIAKVVDKGKHGHAFMLDLVLRSFGPIAVSQAYMDKYHPEAGGYYATGESEKRYYLPPDTFWD